MSNYALNWAWRVKLENPRHKLVLLKVADHANDDGVSWPSVRTMERDTGISKSACSRIVNALSEQGWLHIQQTTKLNGRPGPNVYHLHLPAPDEGPITEPTPPKVVPPGDEQSHSRVGQNPQLQPSGSTKPRSGDAAAPVPAPRRSDDGMWHVTRSDGRRVVLVNLRSSPPTCTCENRSSSRCVHIKAAEVAEERFEKARRRELRDAVWDALGELFGKAAERQKRARGAVCESMQEILESEGVEARPEVWSAEVKRRHRALAAEWGAGKVTQQALAQNFGMAGKLTAGELPFPDARRGLSAEEMARQALADEAAGL